MFTHATMATDRQIVRWYVHMHAIHPGAHDDEARVVLLVPEEAVAFSLWPYVGRFSFDIGAG